MAASNFPPASRDQAALHELSDHRAHPLVDHQFRYDEQRERQQEPRMHVHVQKERHLDPVAPCKSFRNRKCQQWQPRKERQDNHTTRHQFQRIARQMRPPHQLKERSTDNQ